MGNNLHTVNEYYVTTDMGRQIINSDIIEKNDQKVLYTFSIDKRTRNIEFAAINQNDKPVEITGITLRKIG